MLHPFHLVSLSPWPLLTSFNLACLAQGGVSHALGFAFGRPLVYVAWALLSLSLGLWVRDVLREAVFLGAHSSAVSLGLLRGFLLFILSEVMVFFSFIWAGLFLGLNPGVELACLWPPVGVTTFNPYTLPLANTALLLTSGASVSWAHLGALAQDRKAVLVGLLYTLVCGLVFSGCQAVEYISAPFALQASAWGGVFFMTTGLHGVHVLLGAAFLGFNLWRVRAYQAPLFAHRGLEASILYWHFVDLVWLFVYSLLYLWV